MSDIQRFGPLDFSGRITRYPVQWCTHMPIGSVASRREIKLRWIFKCVEALVGSQWKQVTIDWEIYENYNMLDAYAAHWGDESVSLMQNSFLIIDIEDWSQRLRDLVATFEPLWVSNRPFIDHGPATIFNRRTPAERLAAQAEKEALLRELDAFDATLRAVV
jgi:hypothetical protein